VSSFVVTTVPQDRDHCVHLSGYARIVLHPSV
jgi:hypothetical protein